MKPDLFNQLQATCDIAGLKCSIEPASEQSPVPQMNVLVHVDERGRSYVVRVLADMVPRDPDAPAPRTQAVDMALVLPFPVAAQAMSDTLRLLNAINLGAVIGAFALSEPDLLVVLRHCWHAPPEDIDARHVLALIDLITFHVTDSAPIIEEVASGSHRYDDIIAATRASMANTGVSS